MTAGAGVEGDARTLADPLAEAPRVVDVADARGLLVRLLGGMGIRAQVPGGRVGERVRRYMEPEEVGRAL